MMCYDISYMKAHNSLCAIEEGPPPPLLPFIQSSGSFSYGALFSPTCIHYEDLQQFKNTTFNCSFTKSSTGNNYIKETTKEHVA